jgi:hypothetical protein
MPMMQYAIEHRGHRCHVTQEFAAVFDRAV